MHLHTFASRPYFHVILIGLICLGVAMPLQAQKGRIRKAEKYYENLMYPKAIRSFEKGLRKYKDVMAMEHLADAYRQVGNTKMAEKWYGEASKFQGAAPITKFHYGEMLKANGKYEEARKWFEAYLQTGVDPHRAAKAIESCDFAIETRRDSSLFTVSTEKFNSAYSDFGPVPYRAGLVVSSERKGAGRKLVNLRNENYFYDLFSIQMNGSKKGFEKKRLKGKVNRRFHEGPATFNKKQDTIYFTRAIFVKGKRHRAPKDHSKLSLFQASFNGRKWVDIKPMPFNSDTYSVGHATLSDDGKTMIFASDIPGGFGGTDLYMVQREGNKWGTPTNLGAKVNTAGEEQFPYLHASGALFFASDGQPGLGGLDLFVSAADGAGWAEAKNLGYPVNTTADDFAMTWLPGRPNGYFTSNRDGDDDIYSFKRGSSIKGTVVDSKTGSPIKGAKVRLLSASGKESTIVTDAKGEFVYQAEYGKDVMADFTADRYLPGRERIAMAGLAPTDDKEVTLKLTPDLIFMLTGNITDATTRQPIEGSTVRLISGREESMSSDSKGAYFKRLGEDTEYTLVVMKKGYVPQVFAVSTIGKTVSEDFVINAALNPGQAMLVEGTTFLGTDKSPIEAVNVHSVVQDTTMNELKASRSRRDGRFWIVLDPTKSQYLIGSKMGYFTSRAEIAKPVVNMDTVVTVMMPMLPYEVGTIVKIIYYDYNKSGIVDSASKDLIEIVYFLNDNPEASVELSSHTDSRGGNDFNAKLSQARADAAVGFIRSRGIENNRIVAKGYGESALVNDCVDNAKCTEAQHAKNRRTEIKVVKLATAPGN